MVKGETPFDLAKAQEVLATFAEDAKEMPTLFPDCSKTGDHTTAAPAIWDKADDFKAAVTKFAADVKAAVLREELVGDHALDGGIAQLQFRGPGGNSGEQKQDHAGANTSHRVCIIVGDAPRID